MKKILFSFLALCSFFGLAFGDITWNTPVAISTAATDATAPVVVIDTSNNATAVWVEGNLIQTSSLPSGGSWGPITTLSNPVNTASSPKLNIDGSGNVTAMWIENNIVTSALNTGGTWGSSVSVSSASASEHQFVVDSSGNAVAVWVRGGFIEAAQRNSGTWGGVSVLSAASSDNPYVAISNGFGKALAAWHTVSSGSDLIVTNILTIGGSWGTSKNVFIAAPAFKHNYPKVAMDQNGNGYLAWFRYNLVDSNAYENVQVLASTLTQGAASWSIGQLVSSPGIRNPADLTLRLKTDADGDVIAAWMNSYDGENFFLETSQKVFGAPSFGSVLQPDLSLYTLAFEVAIASDTALMLFMDWDGTNLIMQSQESDINNPVNQSWTTAETVSSGTDNGFPSCGLSIDSGVINAVAVWEHFDGTNTVIHAVSGVSTVIDPPSAVSASQSSTSFGVYTDYVNTITWTGSSDPNVVQYNLYRNGVFFAATDSSTFTFDDHNTINSGTVTYGVAAFTANNRQSELVTFTLFP